MRKPGSFEVANRHVTEPLGGFGGGDHGSYHMVVVMIERLA